MAEYIEREKLLRDINHYHLSDGKFQHWVEVQPAADVAPVVHGRWIERRSLHAMGGISAECSVCSKSVQYLGNPLNYCPNCGAKMDGGNQNV